MFLNFSLALQIFLFASIFLVIPAVLNPLVAMFGISKYRRYLLSRLTRGWIREEDQDRRTTST
jgi:hypothetical protein